MSQLAASDGQPGNWEEPGFFLRRLETVRFQENGWQEPYESRGSRTEPGRPEEFHLQSPSEPCVNLSIHTAPVSHALDASQH